MAELYTGTGGINTGGCADARQTFYYYSYFNIGEEAFVRYKAHYGVLEKVVIKKVLFQRDSRTNGQLLVKYKDTLNGLWIDGELVDEITALLLIQDYFAYQEQIANLHPCR